MQFNFTSFLIFLAFVVPGFIAQKSRESIVPRSFRPSSTVSEIGEFVLAGVWVHLILILCFRFGLALFFQSYFGNLFSDYHQRPLGDFIWYHRRIALFYFVCSLGCGYVIGLAQGCLVLKQPARSWLLDQKWAVWLLRRLGISGFLQEQPVWYQVFREDCSEGVQATFFLEVCLKDSAGYYTGVLHTYGILDDCQKSKDFYIVEPHFKKLESDEYEEMACEGVLLNFEDVSSIRVIKVQEVHPHVDLHTFTVPTEMGEAHAVTEASLP